MRNLLKIIFGSCLGTIIALVFLTALMYAISAAIFLRSSNTPVIGQNSVLKINFDRPIPEKTNNIEAAKYNFTDKAYIGLYEIKDLINHAKEDKNIKGIYLDCANFPVWNVKSHILRNALADFKTSGKFVIAYSNNYAYGQSEYHLASVADEIFIHPYGSINLHGFAAIIEYYKELLDKVGINMQVYYAGKYKSATEPFRRNDMSPEAREQIKEYLNPLFDAYVSDIAKDRNLSIDQIQVLTNELDGRNAELALEAGLVDRIAYEDEVFDALKKRLDLDEEESVSFTSIYEYYNSGVSKNIKLGDKIAVVYAEGNITGTSNQLGSITPNRYINILRDIRKDDKVKAVIMRINSPGGDAMVSDRIWRELKLFEEKGIPVITSMGNVAASGGYYLASGSEYIFAEPTTITGSIGVFGIIPNVSKLLDEKIGIDYDTVKTNKYATGLYNTLFTHTPEQARFIQQGIDRTYETFLSRVAEARNMTRDEVHEVAQGRVWTGAKAQELNLVDAMGGLEDAIQYAANKVGLSDYRLSEYPRIKDPKEQLIEDLMNPQFMKSLFKAEFKIPGLTVSQDELNQLKELFEKNTPQALLPFRIIGAIY